MNFEFLVGLIVLECGGGRRVREEEDDDDEDDGRDAVEENRMNGWNDRRKCCFD